MARISGQRLALLLTASFATLLVALAFTSTSASALNFCGGQIVNNHQTCFGTERTFYWIRAVGNQTGVCVGYNATEFLACSLVRERGYWAEYRFSSNVYGVPRVVGMSPNNTVVGSGETYQL
jgi:hypothetical protein